MFCFWTTNFLNRDSGDVIVMMVRLRGSRMNARHHDLRNGILKCSGQRPFIMAALFSLPKKYIYPNIQSTTPFLSKKLVALGRKC